MALIDLTHTITSDIMVYPGTEPADLFPVNTMEKDGFRETLFRMSSHTGTHMDAPAHMLWEGTCLDRMDVNTFAGRAYVLDCTSLPPGPSVTLDLVKAIPQPETLDFVLLATGWDRFWNTPAYFSPFPILTEEAAGYLADLGLKGIGVDAMSIDTMDSTDYPIHHILFRRGMLSVENLRGLIPLAGQFLWFAALPLRFRDADGSPIRAVCTPETP